MFFDSTKVPAMKKAKIIEVKEGPYGATMKNTRVPQREKLEETIVNLPSFLGAKVIKRALIQMARTSIRSVPIPIKALPM
jgi:hypothetical protein